MPGLSPCIRANRSRTLLAGSGLLGALFLRSMMYTLGDNYSINDVALPLTATGITALSGGVVATVLSAVGFDGPVVFDRVTPATVALALSPRSSAHTDESLPYGLALSLAPTYRFGNRLGRLRLVGQVATELGQRKERDPRPQVLPGQPLPLALKSHDTSAELGLDLAFYLGHAPGPTRQSSQHHRFELRYKPLLYLGHEQLKLSGQARSSTRLAIIPLNLGIRWNLSPRQRFTVYLSPRWDIERYGGSGHRSGGKARLAPLYAEAWFDLDLPFRNRSTAKRIGTSTIATQLTLGYRHFRFLGPGINVGSYVGFFGQAVSQIAVRLRPLHSKVAYQLDLGVTVGSGVTPRLRFGIVLPDFGAAR